MRYTLQNIAKDVDRKLHVGAVEQTQDFYGAIDEARGNMIGRISPPELERTAYIEEALYDQVDRYAVPYDLNYDNVLDMKYVPADRNLDTLNHPLRKVSGKRFSQKRGGARNVFSIEWENGIQFIKIFKPLGLRSLRGLDRSSIVNQQVNDGIMAVITRCDSLTENGTWNVGGNITNLRLDEVNHVTGSGSYSFDINNSGTAGFLENFTLEPFSLENFFSKGSVLSWFDFPTVVDNLGNQAITSVKITLGSNAGNLATDLYQFSVNQAHDHNAFTDGWNLLRYPLKDMIQVGNPNPLELVYVRFDITTTGYDLPNCHMDSSVARQGELYQLTYNSAFCIIDAINGGWKQFGTQLADRLPFQEDTYKILMLETAKIIQQEVYGSNIAAKSDVVNIDDQLERLYAAFEEKYPSEEILETEDLYEFGNYLGGYYTDPMGGSDSVGGF